MFFIISLILYSIIMEQLVVPEYLSHLRLILIIGHKQTHTHTHTHTHNKHKTWLLQVGAIQIENLHFVNH